MVKLPVFDVLGQAFTAPFRFAWPLLPFFIVAGILVLGLVFIPFLFLAGPETVGGAAASLGLQNVILISAAFLAAYLVFTSVAVATHRVAAKAEHPWRLLRPVVRYFFIALLLTLIGLVFFAAGFAIIALVSGAQMSLEADASSINPTGAIAMVPFVLFGVAIGARLFLALPAAALQKKNVMSLAWRVSQGSTLRLLGAWVLYFILMVAINAAAFLVVGGTNVLMQNPEMTPGNMLGAMGAGWLIVNVVVNYYVTVAGAAFLTYSLIALLPNDTAGSPTSDAAA